jgi:hypothetical protein
VKETGRNGAKGARIDLRRDDSDVAAGGGGDGDLNSASARSGAAVAATRPAPAHTSHKTVQEEEGWFLSALVSGSALRVVVQMLRCRV